MERVADTWISSTLATEFVSLAAARACLGVMERENVPATLHVARHPPARRARSAWPPSIPTSSPAPWDCRRCVISSSATTSLAAPWPSARRGVDVLWKRSAYNFVSLAHDDGWWTRCSTRWRRCCVTFAGRAHADRRARALLFRPVAPGRRCAAQCEPPARRRADRHRSFHVASILGSWGLRSPTYFPSPDDLTHANAALRALTREHPDRIRGYVAVNPNFTAHALAEIRTGAAAGMIGVKLAASRRANDPLLDPVASLAGELGLPVLHHIWQNRRHEWPGQEASDAGGTLPARGAPPARQLHPGPHRRRW